jgi:hypothetical protein
MACLHCSITDVCIFACKWLLEPAILSVGLFKFLVDFLEFGVVE